MLDEEAIPIHVSVILPPRCKLSIQLHANESPGLAPHIPNELHHTVHVSRHIDRVADLEFGGVHLATAGGSPGILLSSCQSTETRFSVDGGAGAEVAVGGVVGGEGGSLKAALSWGLKSHGGVACDLE